LQQGGGRSGEDDAIRRIPAQAIEELVLERLRTLSRKPQLSWSQALGLLARIEVHSETVHLSISRTGLIGPHADLDREILRLQRLLGPDDRLRPDAQVLAG